MAVETDADSPDPRQHSFRTAGAPPGFFRHPGDLHVHVDGARRVDELLHFLSELDSGETAEGTRFPGKLNRVLSFSRGPQRDDWAFVETYRCHTPGSAEHEVFGSFSTIRVGSRPDLSPESVTMLCRLLELVADQPEAVVELERVVGVLEPGNVWHGAAEPLIADPKALSSSPLERFPRRTTSPIEIHHSIDIPKTEETGQVEPVLTIDRLPTWPNLGGWFLFDHGDCWAFRSSEFARSTVDYRYAASLGQRRLEEFLTDLAIPYTLHTLVEQVLGIWRGGEQPTSSARPMTALGQWEMSCPPEGHVWVIAGDFFGDQSPDVRRAMLHNLARDVSYTYFLRTHADILRLGLLSEHMERDLVAAGCAVDRAQRVIAKNIRCVLLWPELDTDERLRDLLRSDYFLCPHDDEMGGYRLESSGLAGRRIDPDDLSYLVDALTPVVDTKIRGVCTSSEESWVPKSFFRAVLCTDLEETAAHQDQETWRQMLAEYDRIVARQVSMHGTKCLVVRPVRNGYLVAFVEPSDAAAWSRRLQFEVHRRNEEIARTRPGALSIPKHNIALGYGSVSRVLRAHGYDFIGGVIDDCIELAPKLQQGLIAMSRPFADQYESQVGRQEFLASTNGYSDAAIGEFRVLQWP